MMSITKRSGRALRSIRAALLAGLVLSLIMPLAALADEKPQPAPLDNRQIWLRISVISLTEEGSHGLGDKDVLPPESLQRLIDARMARELETFYFPARNGRNTMASIGHKFPLTYFDPKASQYQIIFVDVGMKFNIKPVISPGERIDMEIKSDISTIEDYRQEIERDTVFYYPSTKNSAVDQFITGMRNGEALIISNFQGLSLENVLKSLGEKETFYARGSRLIIAVTPYFFPSAAAPLEAKDSVRPRSIEMKVFSLPRALSRKREGRYTFSEGELAALVKSGGAKLIDSQKILSSASESVVMIGRKYPLAYFDPRSGMYQVMYIDIGLKGVVKCRPLSGGHWNVEAKLWLGNADPSMLFGVRREQIPLKIYTIASDVNLEIAGGESGIITSLRGEYFYKVIKDILFPGIQLSADDELIIVVSVK
jgi:hypothetical protein